MQIRKKSRMEWGKALSFLENNYQREAMGSLVFAKKIISLHSNFLLLHRINYTTEFSFCKLGGTITQLGVKVGISKRWKIPSQSLSFFLKRARSFFCFALHAVKRDCWQSSEFWNSLTLSPVLSHLNYKMSIQQRGNLFSFNENISIEGEKITHVNIKQ